MQEIVDPLDLVSLWSIPALVIAETILTLDAPCTLIHLSTLSGVWQGLDASQHLA